MTPCCRLLSEVQITSLETLKQAIEKLHKTYRVPHIIVTSIRSQEDSSTISIIGSTARSDFSTRIFQIEVPNIDCYFSGTGDMFAALTLVRLKEAATQAGLVETRSWVSPDNVEATQLPLAQAAEKVLGSMQAVLERTKEARDQELKKLGGPLGVMEKERDSEKRLGLRRAKAAEVRVVRCLRELKDPDAKWKAVSLEGKDTTSGYQRDEIPKCDSHEIPSPENG